MTLNELKTLLGVELEDVSQDVRLEIELEAGIKAASVYCDQLDFMQLIDPMDGKLKLPGTVKLGISEWIKANQGMSERGGVVAESIGGMSQSFGTDEALIYGTAYRYWSPYHSDIRFFRA
ncbi:phage head-tail connector protein [Exiguobacterium sp. R-39]|uniref:phage head-tail connector protein n=1 Tax=Exiguobacterium sp. R-39 TaxID=3416708 RepID=UPI003CF48AD3